MEINKKQLKIISYDFRCIANRLMNANFNNSMSILKMFLKYIEKNELIYSYISSKLKNSDNIDYQQYSGHAFTSLGDTPDEEISFIYQYLRYGSEHFGDYHYGFALRYSSGGAQNSVKEFNNRVVLPLINYIEQYLTQIGIEMGYDEDVKYMITVNNENGQVNISQDKSTINAVQNQNARVSELDILIDEVKKILNDQITSEDKETIIDTAECLKEELQKELPKKGIIKTCINGLNSTLPKVKGAAELAAAVIGIIEFASKAL